MGKCVSAYAMFPEVEIVHSTSIQAIISKLDRIFATHGIPVKLTSDNGPRFNGAEFDRYMKALNIEWKTSTPLWPQGNSNVESFNKTLVKVLQTAQLEERNWRQELQRFLLSYRVTVGLHQGSALSPFLFAVIIDCITADIQREAPQDMLFADDVILCADIREELGTRLETWRGVMEDRGMRVSRKKTEYLCLEIQKEAGTVKMQGEELNRVEEFKYLGSTVQADGGAEKEVVKRVQAGWRAWKKVTGIMCDRTVPDKIKGRLYKVMVRPAMLYGMEAVAVTKAQERKMEVAEMKMLRFSIGKTRLDRIRNEEVRRSLGVVELGHQLRETRMRWLGHITRREETYVGKRMRQMVVGKRKTEEKMAGLH